MNRKCVLLGLLTLIFAVMAIGNCSDVSDAEESSESIECTFYEPDGRLTVTGSGDMPDYKLSGSKKVTRPWEEVVTSIKTVTINGFTSIGTEAFSGCSSLTSVIIDNTVQSIGEEAFSGCGSLTSVNLGTSVKSIGREAFYACGNLKSITLPTSVTTISQQAFLLCSGLTEITIPDSVTSIGTFAFRQCGALESIHFGKGITSVPEYCCYGCGNLTSVTFSGSLKTIGGHAFQGCKIGSVTIPSTVTYLGDSSFSSCPIASVDIPASVETLGSSAFNGCTNLKSVTLHDGLKTIESSAFNGCTSLESIIIPDSVTDLGYQAVYNCSSLKEVSFPLHLNAVRTYTVDYTGKSYHVFGECNSIEKITFTGTGSGPNYSADSGSDTYYQNTPWYTNREHLTEIIWNCDNLQSIGSNTFRGLTALTTVTLGKNILSIEDYAFYGCNKLQTIAANDKIISIGAGAFGNCSSLTSIIVPDSVLTIGEGAFGNCSSLTSVTVGSGIRYIGTDAFKGVTFYDGKTVLNADADSLLNRTFSGTVSKMVLTSTVKYAVKFVTDGNTTYEYSLEYNGTIIAPTDIPTKDKDAKYSYTFEKWDGFTEGMTIGTGDVTFEAVFTKTLNKYAYSVVFTTGSREVAPTISGTADYGTVIDIEPVKVAGYTTPQPSSVTVTENTMLNYLTYEYQPITYTLTFNDGNKTTPVNYTVENASINVPDVTEKKGYSGTWEPYDISILKSRTINAVYTPNTYTMTFDDGTNSTPVRFTVETTEIEEPALTEKTGYAGEWEKYDLKDLSDRTVKAQYTAKNYHVKFISEGEVFYEYDLGFGSPIVLPAEVPTKVADTQYTYTFQKWDGFTEGMTLGASDMSFEALFGSQSVVRTDTEGKVWIESDTSVPLSAKQIESIKTDAENNSAVTLTLSSGECKATFDNTALTSLKIDSDAVFSIESVPADEMTQEVRDLVKDNTLYSISFGSNTDFGNGTVTVTVPYELNGKDPSGLSVCYISEGKIAEKLDCTYDNGTVTFETKHFSLYAIIPSENESHSDVIYIVAALIALFAVFAVGVVLRRRSS